MALRREGIKERHWQQIFALIKLDLQKVEYLNFKYFLDKGIEKYKEEILEITEKAFKEFKIEEQLEDMNKNWEHIVFELTPIKSNKVLIIKGFDRIFDMLDMDILKTQRLQFSIYKKHFENDILIRIKLLTVMSDVIEEWAKFQQKWIYLFPIFGNIKKNIF